MTGAALTKSRRLRLSLTFLLLIGSASFVVAFGAEEGSAEELSPLEQLDFAKGLFQRGMYEMALREFEKFIGRFPESEYLHEAYFGIAESHFFAKNRQKAIEAYETYRQRFPNGAMFSLATLRIGQSFFLTNQYKKALQYFASVKPAALDDNYRQVLYLFMGRCYKIAGKIEEALASFRKATERIKEGEHASYAFLELAELTSEGPKSEEAITYYDRAYQGAQKDIMKSFVLHKKGEMQFSTRAYAAAAETFKNVVEHFPEEKITRDSFANLLSSLFKIARFKELVAAYEARKDLIRDYDRYFSVFYVTADAYEKLLRYDESLRVLDEAVRSGVLSEKNRHTALIKKAAILLKTKRYREALETIEGALKEGGRADAQSMFLKAEAAYGLEKFGDAYEAYQAIVENYPKSPFSDVALYGMAYTQNALGNDEKARERFIAYFEHGNDAAKRREALYNAILKEMKLGNLDAAIEHSETFLAVFQKSPLAEKVIFRLGTLYSQTKQHTKAVTIFKRFMRQFKKSEKTQEVYFLTAYNLQSSERFDEALLYYKKVTRQEHDAKLYYAALKNTALLYLNSDNNKAAAETFDRIITGFENNDLEIDTYFWLAKQYISAKAFEDTLRILRNAESRKEGKIKRGEIAYFRAEAYRGMRDYEKALKEYSIAISLAEGEAYSGAARIGKGLCLMAANDPERAKEAFKAAIEENPEDNTITMRARFEMANIARLQKDYEAASKLYLLVSILYNDKYYCPEALFRAAAALKKQGKPEEALKAYREIVEKYRTSHVYKKAQDGIAAFDEK